MQDVSVKQLSDWLLAVQKAQAESFPETELLIGGGSARDILDHVLFARPLITRDVDLFLISGGIVRPQHASKFFRGLEQDGLGALQTHRLRPKKRCNPALPVPQRYDYVAGYGAHFFRPGMPILSVSILHQEDDLKLNGLLNIDKVYLRLRPGETLSAFSAAIHASGVSYRDLVKAGFIRDDSHGYPGWVESRPELLNWGEVARSPLRMAIRITRSFAKAGAPDLPDEVNRRFSEMVADSSKVDDDVEFKRGFVKVFSDRHWTNELNTLAQMGVLQHISGELEKAALGIQNRKLPKTYGDWSKRWNSVLEILSQNERARLAREMAPALASSFA